MRNPFRLSSRIRRYLGASLALLGGALLVWECWPREKLPTAEVKRGEWVDLVALRGEVKALRSITLTAPANAGDLRILKIVATGTALKAGDVVAQFDPTRRRRQLDEERTTLKQSEAEIDRTRAQNRLRLEKSRTDLMSAEYSVERARLEASKQEILAEIMGQKAQLDLADSQLRLQETRASDRAAAVASQTDGAQQSRRRTKAGLDVKESERSIAAMTLRAPVAGIINLLPNYRARSGYGEAPDFKEGDPVWSGAPVAELPDLSAVYVTARMDETDRQRVRLGQEASVRLDALPDREFKAKVSQISTLAKPDYSTWPPPKSFDITLDLTGTDPRLRPGLSANARITVERRADVLIIPPSACVQAAGRDVAFVQGRWGFSERIIEVGRRTATQVMVSKGLRAGERVALRDPRAPKGEE